MVNFDAAAGFRYLSAVSNFPKTSKYRIRWQALAAATLLACTASGQAAKPEEPVVTGLSIRVELQPERGILTETVRVTVEGRSGSKVRFRLNPGLRLQRTRADSGAVDHRQAGDHVLATFEPALDGDRRTVTFQIAGRPRHAGVDRITPERTILGGADYWVPTLPATRAAFELEVVVPQGWAVLASGKPLGGSPVQREDGSPGIAWRFASTRPVRTVGLAAAPGLRLTESELPGTTLRVAGGNRPAPEMSAVFGDPMTWLSGTLVPYPFEGINLAFLPELAHPVHASGFAALPYAHPLANGADGADVLAVQWFGQLLAADGPWIDGLAAWHAISYARDRALPLPASLAAERDRFLALYRHRDTAISRAGPDTPREVLRGKGSAAWEAVHQAAGTRHFLARRDVLLGRREGGPLSLEEVREKFIDGSSEPLDRVFSDWFDRTGVPELEAGVRTLLTSRSEWRTDLTIRQRGRPYALILDVVFHGAGRQHRERIRIDQEINRLLYMLPFEAVRVELDPLGSVYKQPTTYRNR